MTNMVSCENDMGRKTIAILPCLPKEVEIKYLQNEAKVYIHVKTKVSVHCSPSSLLSLFITLLGHHQITPPK